MPARIGIVVLAAGGSSRLGQPKQLVRFDGQSLVRRAAEVALAAGGKPVVVVLGAAADECEAELNGVPVQIVQNDAWSRGMGGSIGAGVAALLAAPIDALVIMLCDQPQVDAALLRRLIETHHSTTKPIVAVRHDGGAGVPALFAREFFERLLALRGDQGARAVIAECAEQVAVIDPVHPLLDVDTHRDLPGG